MNTTIEYIATHKFTHQKPDGTIISWHQEDESQVMFRSDAVAVVQRTINFWVAKTAADIVEQRHIPLAEAEILAEQGFRDILSMMLNEPFPKKWEFTLEDFTIKAS